MKSSQWDKADSIILSRLDDEKNYCRKTQNLSLEMGEDCILHCDLAGTRCCDEIIPKAKHIQKKILDATETYRRNTLKFRDSIEELSYEFKILYDKQPKHIQEQIEDETMQTKRDTENVLSETNHLITSINYYST